MTPARVAAILAAIGLVSLWQLTLIPESAIQMTVGAQLVPAVIVGLLLLLTGIYAFGAWRGKQVDESHSEGQSALPGSTLRLMSLLAAGVAFMLGLPWLGFVLPATACGMFVARSFDAPFNVKSALICGAIALLFWVLFARILGVSLGPASPFGF
jgi:hypothetical protein